MEISFWGIIWAWLTGGGSVGIVDYVLNVLNKFLQQPNVTEKIAEGYALAKKVYGYLIDYSGWCPSKWRSEYDATVVAVKNVVDTFEDGKVEKEEIDKCVKGFKDAYNAWMAD